MNTPFEAAISINADSDIEKLLKEAEERGTDAYKLGCIEERLRIFRREISAEMLNLIESAAYVFYTMLSNMIGADKILQYRAGVDYTTCTPTVFTVITQDLEDRLGEICDLAGTLELYFAHNKNCNCQLWVTTDISLDHKSIDSDFPHIFPYNQKTN